MSQARILAGSAADLLPTLETASADALVTDPPAGIALMGATWDGDRGGRAQWVAWLAAILAACRRVLVPGAHALVWALPRTAHWTATAVEDAGFEVRDVVVHLQGQGFPKSKALLKPAAEHWILARAPGPLRPLGIDACRVQGPPSVGGATRNTALGRMNDDGWQPKPGTIDRTMAAGRWPANCTLEHAETCADDACAPDCPVALLDAQSGELTSDGPGVRGHSPAPRRTYGVENRPAGTPLAGVKHDSGGASRFFFCAKAKGGERKGNAHPTAKPLALMRWLVRLVCPPGGTVLDPFAGSGTTLEAALAEGRSAVGIELDAVHATFARERCGLFGRVAGC